MRAVGETFGRERIAQEAGQALAVRNLNRSLARAKAAIFKRLGGEADDLQSGLPDRNLASLLAYADETNDAPLRRLILEVDAIDGNVARAVSSAEELATGALRSLSVVRVFETNGGPI